ALAEGVAGAGSVEPPAPVRPVRGRGGGRVAVLVVLGLYFAIPLAASTWFTVRDRGAGGFTAEYYAGIPGAEGFAAAFGRSLAL
ncbi:hypothetical protein ACQ1ZK_20580, partial [Enterococcus faecium]